MNFLEDIIAFKKKELPELIRKISLKELEKSIYFERQGIPLTLNILDPQKPGIIAEFKRSSPSQGKINITASVKEVTTGYSKAGASGLSILTEHQYFGGSCADLSVARKFNVIPVLRKDFIINEYQVIESKAFGADAILLIAAALQKDQIFMLARLARSIGLQVLLEIHCAEEIHMANEYVDIIGVNNRNLRTFLIDTAVSMELAGKIPSDFVKISESGISEPGNVLNLRKAGYQGFLIGGSFMKSNDPAASFAGFIEELKVKECPE